MAPKSELDTGEYRIRKGPGKFDFMTSLFSNEVVAFEIETNPFLVTVYCVVTEWTSLWSATKPFGSFEARVVYGRDDIGSLVCNPLTIAGRYTCDADDRELKYLTCTDERGLDIDEYRAETRKSQKQRDAEWKNRTKDSIAYT